MSSVKQAFGKVGTAVSSAASAVKGKLGMDKVCKAPVVAGEENGDDSGGASGDAGGSGSGSGDGGGEAATASGEGSGSGHSLRNDPVDPAGRHIHGVALLEHYRRGLERRFDSRLPRVRVRRGPKSKLDMITRRRQRHALPSR